MGESVDALERMVRDGELVAMGAERSAFVTRAERGRRPTVGDVLPGPFVVTAVDTTPSVEGWHVRAEPLVPPRSVGQRRPPPAAPK